jgi:hypothetical protein
MEATHGVKVRGQRVALACLELLDEGLILAAMSSCAVVFFSVGMASLLLMLSSKLLSGPYPLLRAGRESP